MYAPLATSLRRNDLLRLAIAVLAAVAITLVVVPTAKVGVSDLTSTPAATPSRHTATTLRPSAGLAAAIARLQRRDHPSWAFTSTGGNFATHLSPGLPTTVGSDGTVRIVDPPARIAVALTPVGVGRSVQTPIESSVARATGHGIVQSLGPVTARYANSAAGLEQTLVLDRRPVGSGSTVIIGLRASGATPSIRGSSVRFSAGGLPVLSYGGLRVHDANGRSVPARFSVVGADVQIVINDHGARYPLTVDPKFTSSGSLATGGTSVSISDNGKIAVVGGAWDDDPSETITSAGQAFVLAQNAQGEWNAITLTAPSPLPSQPTFWETSNGYFGYAVAISSDGEEAVVTGPGIPAGFGGVAFVFSISVSPTTGLPTATWGGYMQPETTTHMAPGGFGLSAAVWHDAALDETDAFVGAPYSSNGGGVYEFTDPTLTKYSNNGNYSPDQNATALYDASDPGTASAAIGTSIALSPQQLLFAGGPKYNSNAGIVTNWLWSSWPHSAQTEAGDYGGSCSCSVTGSAAGDLLGQSVSADAAGTLYAAGEPGAIPDGSTVASGAVVIAEYAGLATDFGPKTGGVSGEAFGTSVAMSDDGSTVLVGAPISGYSVDAPDESGLTPYAYVESSTGASWASPVEQAFVGQVGTYYGERVAMAGNLSDALVGAPMANLDSFTQGEAYYLAGPPPPSPPILSGTPGPGVVGSPYSFSFAVGGSPLPTLSVTSGALPPGVTLSGHTLTGTPTTVGSYSATVTATSHKGSASDAFTIAVSAPPLPTVTSLSPKKGTVAGGTAVTINGTGFTGATEVVFGTKAGTKVKVVSSTKLTVVSPKGTNSVAVAVTTPAGTSGSSSGDVYTFSSTAVDVTTTTLASATVGVAYSANLVASGGTPPYSAWSKSSGTLPPGLGGPTSTGTISGTPTTAGKFTFVVKLVNGGSNDTRKVTLVVAA